MKIKKWLEIKIYDEWKHKGQIKTRTLSESKIIRTEFSKEFFEALFNHILGHSLEIKKEQNQDE